MNGLNDRNNNSDEKIENTDNSNIQRGSGDLERILTFLVDLIDDSESGEISLKNFYPSDKSNSEMIKNYLDDADRDFKASKDLFLNSDFPNAIYHLQQGVEKLTKAFSFFNFPLTNEEIRKTGHISPKNFLLLLQKPETQNLLKQFKGIYPDLDLTPLDKLKDTINKIKLPQSKLEISHLPDYFISDLLNICRTFLNLEDHLNIKDILNINIGDNWETLIKNLVTKASKEFTNPGKDIDKIDISFPVGQPGFVPDFRKDIDKIDISSVIAQLSNIISLTLLSIPIYLIGIITYPHESFTRYSDGDMKPKDYNDQLGIVQSYDRIFKTATNASLKLKTLLSNEIKVFV